MLNRVYSYWEEIFCETSAELVCFSFFCYEKMYSKAKKVVWNVIFYVMIDYMTEKFFTKWRIVFIYSKWIMANLSIIIKQC